ncbi:MAG: serine/threonine-protein kinase [Pyrinomonadaceae bacterium]
METENWKKVKELLHEVLPLEPSRRRNFLDASGASAEILEEVESLVGFEQEAVDLMNLSAVEFSREFFDEDDSKNVLTGQNVGVYKIIGELGFGGMGAVYLAERDDGKFEQKVAVKLLKREFNVEKIRRHFERERQIQSKLNHANIARLLDAGTTADGVPYLVMEYVEGEPIDKFCEIGNLSLTARLKIFNKVCDAVSFAHQNLTIHRDLKPSNILVTAGGEPKLLDFGISKLLDESCAEDKTAITILGAMTPEYASPEQIKGEQVTTATDIYSLGVILYKILTGALPLDSSGKTNGENEPAMPSETYREEGKRRSGEKEFDKFSAKNSLSPLPPFSSSELKGDIDNIILKSLCKEPERRYQTVEQFSADIWRFIDGMPILARPATFSYQASKFYRRNKISVLAGVLILISLFAGITIAIWQANAARAQAQIASEAQRQSELETERANSEKEKAEKISHFMSKIISYANPAWYAEGAKFNGETRVIDVLNEMGEKLDIEFAGQPDIQAELHHKFAEVYSFQIEKALNVEETTEKYLYHARRAIELRRQFYGERHELVAKDMFYLWGSSDVKKGDQAKFLAEAIQMMRETNPHNLNLPYMLEAYTSRLMLPDTQETHEQYLQAVIPATDENKYQIAERYLLESLPIFREYYKEDNSPIFANECKLAYAEVMQSKFAEAEPHYRICRESVDKLQNKKHLEIMRKYSSLIEEAAAANNFSFSNQ